MSTKVITLTDVKNLIQAVGYQAFTQQLVAKMHTEFARWNQFEKTARIPFYRNSGVMELMPICGPEMFSYKYVNGHPNNPQLNKLTVVGSGLLAKIDTGEPLLISEMTLLTGIRTGATSLLASQLLAKPNSTRYGIIGSGSQSEFQAMAHVGAFDLQVINYFDVDAEAMDSFAKNLSDCGVRLHRCTSAQEVVENSDIVTTCTAFAGTQQIIRQQWLQPGQHINAIGGDSPHKTELDPAILTAADILAIEFFDQTVHEGEIQNLEHAKEVVDAELWEIITGAKNGRTDDSQITVFDGVGFALEDYCVLVLVHELTEQTGTYTKLDMTPELEYPKDLFGLLRG